VNAFSFPPVLPPAGASALRSEIRGFIAEHVPRNDAARRTNCWAVPDAAFSRALGAAGFIGMTWPVEYGGQGRSVLDRYIVQEELLAAGAPVGMHWIADRQTGTLLLRFGTEAQRRRYLPGMARGEVFACIGMSEPNSGSDLASVRTRAERTDGGWRVSGQKVWTTNAHHAAVMVTLVRSAAGSQRQEGLTQLLIDLASPGVTIRPIRDMTGGHDFNEVFLDDVFVPDGMMLGEEGSGWHQVTAELALERSGPERYLSSYTLLAEFVRVVGPSADPAVAGVIGRAVAELWTLRQMSMSVIARLHAGEEPGTEAAIVKDLGNLFEQEMPRAILAALPADIDLTGETDLARMLALLLQMAPSFSLRGGTREILRGIISRALGLR